MMRERLAGLGLILGAGLVVPSAAVWVLGGPWVPVACILGFILVVIGLLSWLVLDRFVPNDIAPIFGAAVLAFGLAATAIGQTWWLFIVAPGAIIAGLIIILAVIVGFMKLFGEEK